MDMVNCKLKGEVSFAQCHFCYESQDKEHRPLSRLLCKIENRAAVKVSFSLPTAAVGAPLGCSVH